jgi:UDP-N-acetylglucosamine--N-acetylmuramyl-(pentapeptide) pyrophosphoryl-undecaprenol N-acetylglucosamine transferase
MDLAFSLADLIVSRSGAATVSEVSALGIPALYVPYSVGNGEQRLNAASAVAAGAARLLDDATFDGDAVRSIVIPILKDPQRLAEMAVAAEKVGTRTGTENVIALVDRALAAS